jgi:hypothetical protein
VLVFRATQNKLKADWQEGYEILEVLSEDAYMVKKNNQTLRANKSHLKRAYS